MIQEDDLSKQKEMNKRSSETSQLCWVSQISDRESARVVWRDYTSQQ